MGGSLFYSRVRDAGRVQDFILMSINDMKEQSVFKIFLRDHRDGKCRSYASY